MMKFIKTRVEKYDKEIFLALEKLQPAFTLQIANEIGRDDEYVVKRLNLFLEEGIVELLEKTKYTKKLVRRKLWRIK